MSQIKGCFSRKLIKELPRLKRRVGAEILGEKVFVHESRPFDVRND